MPNTRKQFNVKRHIIIIIIFFFHFSPLTLKWYAYNGQMWSLWGAATVWTGLKCTRDDVKWRNFSTYFNVWYFNEFYVWEKLANFNEFCNGYERRLERTVQLWYWVPQGLTGSISQMRGSTSGQDLILYRAVWCVPRLTQPSTLRETVKWVSAWGWVIIMAMVDVGPAAYRRLTVQVGWLGLKVGSRLALPCIRPMNHVYGAL